MVDLFFLSIKTGLNQCVSVQESVYRYGDESENYQRGDHDADNLKSLEPSPAIPAYGLEHTPEAMAKMEPHGDEPDNVYQENPPGTEGGVKQIIRIRSLLADKLLKLHVSPEMSEVEENDAEDDDSEHEHILR